jgi:predicted O-methyltransferase YrrM
LNALSCPNPVLEEIYRDRVVTLDNGAHRPLHAHIPRDEGDYLYGLVRYLRPNLSIEVGMANAVSSLFIAQGLVDNGCGRHIAIDPFQYSDWAGAGMTALRRSGLDSIVQLIEKPSHQALLELEQQGIAAQFVFIDGSHLFDYVLMDFFYADRLLQVGGLIAFDDSDWAAVTQVIRYILANRKYSVAFPDVAIENPRTTPTLAGRLLRAAGRALPMLGRKLRPDFLLPDEQLGVRGRCVVLRKWGSDDRNSQSRSHCAF